MRMKREKVFLWQSLDSSAIKNSPWKIINNGAFFKWAFRLWRRWVENTSLPDTINLKQYHKSWHLSFLMINFIKNTFSFLSLQKKNNFTIIYKRFYFCYKKRNVGEMKPCVNVILTSLKRNFFFILKLDIKSLKGQNLLNILKFLFAI